MSADKTKNSDYKPLTPSAKNGSNNSLNKSSQFPRESPQSLKPLQKNQDNAQSNSPNLTNSNLKNTNKFPSESFSSNIEKEEPARAEIFVSPVKDEVKPPEDLTYAELQKHRKRKKKADKDRKLLDGDNWLTRNGHTLSYAGLYCFSLLVLFRPYELVGSLSFLASTAFYFAFATLLIYLPTQFAAEGNLTILSTEVKAILALTLLAFLTIPIAKDPPTAWATFNDTFIKAVLMFIVMVNVLRTRRRLMGLMWISLSMAFILSYEALDLYMKGELKTEGYRVDVEIGGMFGNPNDMALHLVTMIPLAVCLAVASKSKIMRLVYLAMATLFVAANFVTYSRGGFLGLVAASAVLVWKLGRTNRLKVSAVSITIGLLVILLAPGNYGVRILSIFGLAADPVGSSDQRRELLIRSIIVTLRNPWGIGIGNFPIVGIHNLVTHNAFTQVSSEIGVLGLVAYVIFMVSPFRKLGAIERTLFAKGEDDWFYYMSIGFQASIVGYMVSSFFVAVAYNWFIYYLIAYAVAFRRIYKIEHGVEGEIKTAPLKDLIGWQTAENNG